VQATNYILPSEFLVIHPTYLRVTSARLGKLALTRTVLYSLSCL
jgi:hypothetical protein